MKKTIIYCVITFAMIFCLYIIYAATNSKMHDFTGKCPMCHVNTPDKNSNTRNLIFTDEIDRLCDKCHSIDKQKSHPIKVTPKRAIPLAGHLNKNGFITCTTCHDIHKEDKVADKSESSGLLWGHLKGRAFCDLCHNEENPKTTWRHQTALPYAHSYGKLIESSGGAQLDRFSTECLSCHDGTISRSPRVEVKQGIWQHNGIGKSHPIGIDYPSSEDFRPKESLPKEIRLFDGKIGCLSCHEIYATEKNMPAMDNMKSRLCLSCHKK